jgi:hypothetical protein
MCWDSYNNEWISRQEFEAVSALEALLLGCIHAYYFDFAVSPAGWEHWCH